MPPLQNPNSFPAPPPNNNGPGQYDFFMDSSNNPKNSMSAGKKLLLIVVAVVVGMAALAVILALLTGGKNESPHLVQLLQSQQEIVRVAQDGKRNAQSENLKNFSMTASAGLSSAQSELTTYVNKLGTKVGKDELNMGKKLQSDAALKAAMASSTYDTTYVSIMQSELNTYEKRLESATLVSISESERAMLQRYTIAAQLLRLQLTTP